MKPIRLTTGIWTLGLFTALLASCAPAASPASDATATRVAPPSATLAAPSDPDEPIPPAQATSRGDGLAASDPAGVVLGTGRPVLIEFFRFT